MTEDEGCIQVGTGDYSGRLASYDLERIGGKPVFSLQAHTSIINAIDGCGGLDIEGGAPEIVTGESCGCVTIMGSSSD